ncbi:MAG: fibronectin type III domain-containing protein, partial [Patescibacteria group bacterium]|nr:fibronectin type III domain-containing protein [Patescibacteria group bacterium]
MFETQSAKEPHQGKTLAKFVAKLKLPKCKMNLSDPQLAKFILKTCILVGIITLVWAGYTYIAEPWAQPEKVRITNITSRSATVTWVTDVETKGMVIYSEKDNFWPSLFAKISKTVSYDDRDVVEARLESAQKESENLEDIDGSEVNYDEIDEEVVVEKVDGYYVHHVTLRSLEPEKTYYFMVGNGLRFSKVEVGANDGGDYTNSLMTYEELEDIPTPNPTYGKVVWESGSEINLEPASDALVYMQAVKVVDEEYSDLLSAVTGSNGSWYIDISNARSEETGELMTNFTDDDMEVISFDAGPVGSLEAFYNSMAKDAPADTFIVRISSGENEDESDDDSEESKVRNILVSEVEAGESECTAEGNTWCGGGSCPDGWSYGPGCWTGSGGCSERDSEACQSHQGSSSSTGTGSTSGSGTTGESSGTTGSVAVGEACTETYTEVQNGQTIQCTKHGIKQSNGECSWGSGSGCTSTRGSDGRCVLGGQVQTGCDGLTECASACFPGDQCTGGNGNTSCCTGTCSATSSSQESTGTGTSTGSGSSTAPTEPQDASCPAGARTNQNITHGECCGWVNTADCTCACSDGSTKQVAWGTKCNCTATTVCCVGLNEEDCNSA